MAISCNILWPQHPHNVFRRAPCRPCYIRNVYIIHNYPMNLIAWQLAINVIRGVMIKFLMQLLIANKN